MRDIGKAVSKKKLNEGDKFPKGSVIDFQKKRVITLDELYTPESATTIDWENVYDLFNRASSNETLFIGKERGNTLLFNLLSPLKEKGEFSEFQKKDFWYLIGAPVGGIEVEIGRGTDPHGRSGGIMEYWHPKREADAVAYAKYFFSNASYSVRPALMGLAANRNWKE